MHVIAAASVAYAAPTRASRPAPRQLRPLVPLRPMQPAKPAGVATTRQGSRVTCQPAAATGITHAVSPISDSSAWADLQKHARGPMPHLRQLLSDDKRCEKMFLSFDGITLDYSRQVRQKATMRRVHRAAEGVSSVAWLAPRSLHMAPDLNEHRPSAERTEFCAPPHNELLAPLSARHAGDDAPSDRAGGGVQAEGEDRRHVRRKALQRDGGPRCEFFPHPFSHELWAIRSQTV